MDDATEWYGLQWEAGIAAAEEGCYMATERPAGENELTIHASIIPHSLPPSPVAHLYGCLAGLYLPAACLAGKEKREKLSLLPACALRERGASLSWMVQVQPAGPSELFTTDCDISPTLCATL